MRHHYLLGIAPSNLASVYMARKRYAHAEQIYREVIGRFTQTQGAGHLNTGIAHHKLGRALVRQERFAEAEGTAPHGLRHPDEADESHGQLAQERARGFGQRLRP